VFCLGPEQDSSELCRSFALGVVRETLCSTILLFSLLSVKYPIFLNYHLFHLLGCVTINSMVGSVDSYQVSIDIIGRDILKCCYLAPTILKK